MAPFATVASSPSAMGTSFHRETIFALARSLAKIPDVGWNEVERALFVHCPKIGEDNQVICTYGFALILPALSSVSGIRIRVCPTLATYVSNSDARLRCPRSLEMPSSPSASSSSTRAAPRAAPTTWCPTCSASRGRSPRQPSCSSATATAPKRTRKGQKADINQICKYITFSLPPQRMPDAEIFSFVFNTLLSDVAARCPDHRDSLIEAQVG